MEEKYTQKIQKSADEIFDIMSKRASAEDLQRIKDAYALAAEAHKDQKRKTGEPYIIHPIAVARIVAEEFELGANPVIAAFLHDVVEDTPYTIDDIRERFGDDVAFLVGVVTKKKKDRYDTSKQVDNFRQILASVQYDVRALLVKLADRLHNMRTLSSMRPDKKMKIAGETDYFYAPLANRLGLYHVKSELENLSFRYRCPREFETISKQIEDYEKNEKSNIDAFIEKASKTLEDCGIMTRVEVRQRTAYNIWRKMQTHHSDFNHVERKHYIRIIYNARDKREEKAMSLRIYAALSDVFKERPGSVVNYINVPKENGYQSFHVMLLDNSGMWEEVHISSERMVRNSRLGCIAERTEGNVNAWIEKFRQILKDVATHSSEIDYMDGVTSSFYYDDIMAFTPKGRGIILPKGGNALDFAFELHTDLGLHAAYARINGRLSSVQTELHRGDCVEIGTSEDMLPQKKWLESVKTYKAKRNLRTYFASKPQLPYIRCCHCHPLPGDEVIGFKDSKSNITIHKRNCPDAIRQASEQGDSIVTVNFEENEAFNFPVCVRITSIDRFHLLIDLVSCITEKLHLPIYKVVSETKDNIVSTTVDFTVHSVNELETAIDSIGKIKNVDEVSRVDIE